LTLGQQYSVDDLTARRPSPLKIDRRLTADVAAVRAGREAAPNTPALPLTCRPDRATRGDVLAVVVEKVSDKVLLSGLPDDLLSRTDEDVSPFERSRRNPDRLAQESIIG